MVFDITVLGANAANFAHGRHHSAQLLNHNQNLFLIDCGEGTQLQLLRYRLKMQRIQHIFITHLHGDHYLGLMGLLLTMQLNGRTSPLFIYGPDGLDQIITLQLRLSDTVLNYPVEFKRIDMRQDDMPTVIFENEHLLVKAVPLSHRVKCHGYIFQEKEGKRRIKSDLIKHLNLHPGQINNLRRGFDIMDETDPDRVLVFNKDVTLPPLPPRSYAYLSDTVFLPNELPDKIRNISLLYHEATFLNEKAARAAITFHSTAGQAAQIASASGVGHLMLGHYSSSLKDPAELLAQAREVFANTIAAEEGAHYTIIYNENDLVEVECQAYQREEGRVAL